MPIVIRIKITQNLELCELENYEFDFRGDKIYYKEFMKAIDINDVRGTYKYIDNIKYDGVITSGSIGGTSYRDITLFRLKGLRVTGYKYYSKKDNEWSSYYSRGDIIYRIFKPAHNRYKLSRRMIETK
ncbi:MAG: hypothetical protein GF317_09885 [Candidatus Lokiarchaeota archaeon]|nr:hypothetical protein [Candidatus Lokiarchaeota archaeon]